jgi:hypothetical protein
MMAAMPSSVKKSIFSSYFLFLVIAFGMGGFGGFLGVLEVLGNPRIS